MDLDYLFQRNGAMSARERKLSVNLIIALLCDICVVVLNS